MHVSRSRRQTVIARNDLKKSIALEILYRNIPLIFDLKSNVNAPEVTKVLDLWCVLGLEISANNI